MSTRRVKPSEAAARRELAEIRARLVALLQHTIGPALTTEEAQSLLEQAQAWSPPMARELHAHIAEHPDALTAPSPRCPGSLPRLLQTLEAAGHGNAVTQFDCPLCGRTLRKVSRPTPPRPCLRLVRRPH